MHYVKFYHHSDFRWKFVKKIETTAEIILEVIASTKNYPESKQYHYEVFSNDKKVVDLYSFNNCLFD